MRYLVAVLMSLGTLTTNALADQAKGIELYKQGKYSEAVSALRPVASEQPSSPSRS